MEDKCPKCGAEEISRFDDETVSSVTFDCLSTLILDDPYHLNESPTCTRNQLVQANENIKGLIGEIHGMVIDYGEVCEVLEDCG